MNSSLPSALKTVSSGGCGGGGFPRSTHKALVSGPPGPPTACQALEGARNSRTGVGWCRRLRRWRWRRRWFCRRFVISFVKLEITSFAFVNSFSSFLMVFSWEITTSFTSSSFFSKNLFMLDCTIRNLKEYTMQVCDGNAVLLKFLTWAKMATVIAFF